MGGNDTVAITGATGFLGTALTDCLLDRGFQVRILARDADKARRFDGRAQAVILGDICDARAVDELVRGADCVVHLVSNFRLASGPPESYRRINVEGTENVLRAARAAGVKRLVYCSTIGVHGDVRGTPANEESPFNPGDRYQETKLEAEQKVRAAAGGGPMEIVVVRPCSMYGPGDLRMLKMFRLLARARFMKIGPCLENFHAVYIDDVVDGFVRAIETPGIDGEVFIIGGEEYLPLGDYIDKAAAAAGAPPPSRRAPYWLVYGVAVACETICVPLGIEPPLHRRRVRFFRNNRAFDTRKARERLGFQPRVSLDEGMQRTVAWYREHGLLE